MKEKNKEPLFHIVKRDALPWYKSLGIRFLAILLALILCGIITTITTGINPLQVYQSIVLGAFGSVRKTWVTFQNIAILLLIALALTPAFKMKFWNIGGEGQVLIGGVMATVVGLLVDVPKPLLLMLTTMAAIAGGALWGVIPGLLKARFNVHEVVSGIMMNWIAYWITYYLMPAYFKGAYETESRQIPEAASLKVSWLTSLFGGEYAAGPGLTFMTMPAVFQQLPFGQGLAVVFFALLVVAALSSAISLLEHLQCFVCESLGWSRRAACSLITALVMAGGIPVSLSFGPWGDLTLFGKNIFELLDFITSNLMMPLFGLALTLLLGWRLGRQALPEGLAPHWRALLMGCWRWLAPLLIGGILVRGLL